MNLAPVCTPQLNGFQSEAGKLQEMVVEHHDNQRKLTGVETISEREREREREHLTGVETASEREREREPAHPPAQCLTCSAMTLFSVGKRSNTQLSSVRLIAGVVRGIAPTKQGFRLAR